MRDVQLRGQGESNAVIQGSKPHVALSVQRPCVHRIVCQAFPPSSRRALVLFVPDLYWWPCVFLQQLTSPAQLSYYYGVTLLTLSPAQLLTHKATSFPLFHIPDCHSLSKFYLAQTDFFHYLSVLFSKRKSLQH